MQEDLFKGNPLGSDNSDEQKSFLERIRISLRFDQITLLAILFIIVNTVIFSVGVESGKRNAVEKIETKLTQSQQLISEYRQKISLLKAELASRPKALEQKPDPVETSQVVREVKEVMQDAEQQSQESKQTLDGKYTIQLATYKRQKDVDQQLARLKSKGLTGFVIPSGSYLQVCVNAFQTKQAAGKLLTDLKAEGLAPRDAYIRSMPAG